MMHELTDYERGLAERFRSSLFDLEFGENEGLIDPSHPEFPAVLAIAYPVRKRQKKTKAALTAKQERMEL